ncbi:MAG TPA: serine/threonine-protein kinase, partial [Polyangiaceae bacterium]
MDAMYPVRAPSLLAEKFKLLHPLGAGGMGELWLAEHVGLGSEVVVKFIAPALAGNPRAAGRFAYEAAATARINSPHVVRVLDYGTSADGAPFLVMEKLEGRDLRACLDERTALPAPTVARIVRQVALALGKAHAAGIIHRDVKPSNVFLCDEGEETFVKLLDFGVAKSVQGPDSSATSSGACVGTPAYMSPEQI